MLCAERRQAAQTDGRRQTVHHPKTPAEYRTKGAVCLSVQWAEETLAGDGHSPRPEKKLKRKSDSIQRVVADAAESPVNRPEENQEDCCLGKNGIR
ncbi:MAG: hypothetical protein LBD58_06525 [Treponema sp.]|nr:hypothetical protein [Treponema sp.]